MLHQSHVFASWLYNHPGRRVYGRDHKTLFWYDKQNDLFLCQNKNNKVRNGVYVARGLTNRFEVFQKKYWSAD